MQLGACYPRNANIDSVLGRLGGLVSSPQDDIGAEMGAKFVSEPDCRKITLESTNNNVLAVREVEMK
jgi:hypothetical protein